MKYQEILSWTKDNWKKPRIAFIAGLIIAITLGLIDNYLENRNTYEDEVHIHADFLIYINDEKFDLTDNRYQSYTGHVLSDDAHLHDNEDHVQHIHAADVTFTSFLDSIGIELNDECLTLDSDENYCKDEESILQMYVNGNAIEDFETYIPEDEDQILLYYGENDGSKINEYIGNITDESCIYSGTCPERGIAPPENCGLTCEL